MSHNLTFKDWVQQEAQLINADGCSKATGVYKFRCRIHDLEYYYGKDATDAYQNYVSGQLNYWNNAKKIERKDADNHFIRGMRDDSTVGFFDPFAFWRIIIKPFGKGAWNKHRKREAESHVITT